MRFSVKQIEWFFNNGHITIDEAEEMVMESIYGPFWMELL